MRQAELDAMRKRDVFEDVCADALCDVFPAAREQLVESLRKCRNGDTYAATDTSMTGRMIAQMAAVSWACWKSACLIG